MQNHNMNIKSEVNLNLKENNNKKNDKKKKINLNSTKLVKQITSFNNIIQNNRNKNEIKSTKTVIPKKIKEDNLIDLLLSDNEFDEPQKNEMNKTKFIKLSTNSFTIKIEKRFIF